MSGVKNGTKYLAHLGAKIWEMIVSEIKQSNPFHVLTTELRHGNLTNAYTVYTSSIHKNLVFLKTSVDFGILGKF